MAIILLESAERKSSWHPSWKRLLFSILGVVLILFGLWMLSTLPIALIVIFQFADQEVNVFREMLTALPALLLALGALFLGYRLLFLLKGSMLYLRKFGFEDSYKVLTYAIAKGLGRRWRMVTLDDSKIKAVGTSWWTRLFWVLGGVFLLVLTGYLLFQFFHLITFEAVHDFSEEASARLDGPIEASNPLEGLIKYGSDILYSFQSGLMIIILFWISLTALIFFSILSTLFVYFIGNQISVFRAERARVIGIPDDSNWKSKTKKVARRMRRQLAPRLVVARVGDAIWQDVVKRLGAICTKVIIDVSESSEHLIWELHQFREERNWVLIGQKASMERLINTSENELTFYERELKQLIDGEEVLVYEESSKEGMRRFAKLLRVKLR